MAAPGYAPAWTDACSRRTGQTASTWLPILFLLLLSGCALPHPNLFAPDTPPLFHDDGDLRSLRQALTNHLHYLNGLSDEAAFTIAGEVFRARELAESAQRFLAIVSATLSPQERSRLLRQHFRILQAGGRRGRPLGEMLVTGYFEPLAEASLSRQPPFIHPLYGPPADLVRRPLADGTVLFGRLADDGRLLPYWTREELETGDMLSGSELLYLADPFDAFLFHVQGSGRVRLRDGTIRSLSYSGNNGQPYASIGKLLVDEGRLPLAEVDTAAIRNYLSTHPGDLTRVLRHNKRYIFFAWGDGGPPRGSLGEPLTAGRSIAVDRQALPAGAIGYLVSRQPVLSERGTIARWAPLRRFVLPQDSGAAIQGPGRVDLFWGAGLHGRIAAGAMKEAGRLYFLLPKVKGRIRE